MEATIAVVRKAYMGTKNFLLKSIQCAKDGEGQEARGRERERETGRHSWGL